MKTSFLRANSLAIMAFMVCAMTVANAQVLMFDFGPTVASGASLTNSPYHTANGAFINTTWNQVQTADLGSGLLWSDGTAATGIALNLGSTTAATTSSSTLGLANSPSNTNALGSTINSGVYATTSVGKDGIYTGTTGNSRAVGFQLSGLAAGTYDIFLSARNTNTSVAHTQIMFLGASATSGDFVLNGAGMTSETLSIAAGTSSATSAWVDNSNYLKMTVVVSSGDVLNLATLGGVGEARGFLNSVQIVAVPEPSTWALLAFSLTTVLVLRRRRA